MKNRVVKEFYTDCTWTAPAGVSSVVVYGDYNKQTSIDFSNATSFGIDVSGTTYSWGVFNCGILGDNTAGASRCTPLKICCNLVFKKVSANGNSAGGLTQDGIAYMWGGNIFGALGDGTATSRCQPVRVCGNLRFKELSVGVCSSAGITPEGCMFTWGANPGGGLGDGTTTNRCCPVAVCGGLRFSKVSVGNGTTLAITCDGCLYSWGYNFSGRLGDGTTTNRCCPSAVCTNLRFRHVFISGDHAGYGVTCDGDGYAWGDNSVGQFGTCCAPDVFCCPVPVCASFKWKMINGTAGIDCDGCAYGWGWNVGGYIGDGTTTGRCCPVPVCGGLRFKQIISKGFTTVAEGCDGRFYSWGTNSSGMLGDGTITNRCCPVAVCGWLLSYSNLPSPRLTLPVIPGTTYAVNMFTFYAMFGGFPVKNIQDKLILEYWA